MKRYAAILLLWAVLLAPATAAPADQDISEGYTRPAFPELIQTYILMHGADINDSKVADEYARIVYCNLYRKNFGNDIAWNKIISQITARAQKRKEYFRVKYEIVSAFNLGRYDFDRQFFPISSSTSIINVGSISLFASEENITDCANVAIHSFFPPNIILQLNNPLTVNGFGVPIDKVEKMMVRIEEAGNADRRVYGRVRVTVTDAGKGTTVSRNNTTQLVLKGNVSSVDFFLDPELTKRLGGVQIKNE